MNSFENESFFGAYRYVGRLYQDEVLKNADAHAHELSLGSEFRKLGEESVRIIFSAFSIAQREGTWRPFRPARCTGHLYPKPVSYRRAA